MSRRGWVSAETGSDTWHLLSVFDDGWVEIPGFARARSDTRANLRRAVLGLVILIGGIAVLTFVGTFLSRFDNPPYLLAAVPLVLAFALIMGLSVWRVRTAWRHARQVTGDIRQARRTPVSSRIRRTPGAPLFRRASTAAQYAGWIEGETHVPAADVVDVSAVRKGKLHVVTVRLADGRARVYRSPDRKLATLLLGLRPGSSPG